MKRSVFGRDIFRHISTRVMAWKKPMRNMMQLNHQANYRIPSCTCIPLIRWDVHLENKLKFPHCSREYQRNSASFDINFFIKFLRGSHQRTLSQSEKCLTRQILFSITKFHKHTHYPYTMRKLLQIVQDATQLIASPQDTHSLH